MRAVIAEDQAFVREEHSIDEGLALFADQPFKREIIEGVANARLTPSSRPRPPLTSRPTPRR